MGSLIASMKLGTHVGLGIVCLPENQTGRPPNSGPLGRVLRRVLPPSTKHIISPGPNMIQSFLSNLRSKIQKWQLFPSKLTEF